MGVSILCDTGHHDRCAVTECECACHGWDKPSDNKHFFGDLLKKLKAQAGGCDHPEDMHKRHANGSYWCTSFGCPCRDNPYPNCRK